MKHILVWMNGEFYSAEKARIPVLDRGFLFGESVYETFRTFHGYPWLFVEHHERLEQSTSALHIPLLYSVQTFWEVVKEGASRISDDVYIRIMVTGGVSDIKLEPETPREPNTLIFFKPFPSYPDSVFTQGVKVTLSATRRNPIFSLDPRIKSCNLLNNIFAYRESVAQGALEPIMLNYEGWVAEGASSNIFIIDNTGMIRTPPLDVGILEGVTRRFVLYLCRRFALPYKEERFKADELFNAREVFITSSLKGIMPVTMVDHHRIGDGHVGPVTKYLMELEKNEIQAYIERLKQSDSEPIRWLPLT